MMRMFRRMEDRIRNLCTDLVATSDSAHQVSIVAKLRDELHRHMQQVRTRLGEYPLEERRRTRFHVASPETPGPGTIKSNSIRTIVIQQDRRRTTKNPTPENEITHSKPNSKKIS